jgi:hypothetical protein
MPRNLLLSPATTVLASSASLVERIALGGAVATSGIAGTVAVCLTD